MRSGQHPALVILEDMVDCAGGMNGRKDNPKPPALPIIHSSFRLDIFLDFVVLLISFDGWGLLVFCWWLIPRMSPSNTVHMNMEYAPLDHCEK